MQRRRFHREPVRLWIARLTQVLVTRELAAWSRAACGRRDRHCLALWPCSLAPGDPERLEQRRRLAPPSPVVAKVAVGHHHRLAPEMAVAKHLASRGAPVVGPATEVPQEVHRGNGSEVTATNMMFTGSRNCARASAHTDGGFSLVILFSPYRASRAEAPAGLRPASPSEPMGRYHINGFCGVGGRASALGIRRDQGGVDAGCPLESTAL